MMQPLSKTLRVQNRCLKQIKRNGMVALYELYGRSGMLYGFELIIVKVHPARIIFGRPYPEREGYPDNEDWGTLAWSYPRNSRKLAEDTFKRLSEYTPALDVNDLEAS